MAVIRFYNTLSRKKEIFRPLKDKRVNLFVCGPTVYDWSHIGHARTYLVYDILTRYLRKIGYTVTYIVNITDISDKIIDRAKRDGEKPNAVARRFERAFYRDMKTLGIRSISRYAPASKFIPEIIRQTQRLIDQNFAYVVNGNVYYRIRKFNRYGRLSGQNLSRLKVQATRASRIEVAEAFGRETEKENPLDFALWKASRPDEPRWKSPWGWGRPGWHIEDTAITETFFGPQYDIHGGGLDLVFPHHECEIAQQEAATGRSPFVRYWLHTGMLKIQQEKMSKSLGNFITIADILKRTKPEVFRLLVTQHHYRSPLNYTENLVKQTEIAHERLIEFIKNLKGLKPARVPARRSPASPAGRLGAGGDKMGMERAIATARKAFYDALADDFNTPKALAEIFKLISRLNPLLNKEKISAEAKQETLKFLGEVDAIFGIIGKTVSRQAPEEIKRLVEKRENLRKEKKWQEADRVRKQVEKLGWMIEDTAAGTRLKKL